MSVALLRLKIIRQKVEVVKMWQERAKALFFMEKKSIKEISIMLFKSEKSIYPFGHPIRLSHL